MHRRDINGKLPELLQCRFHFEVFCGEVHSIASRCATSPCCAWLISSCHSRSIGAESTKGFIFLKNSFRFKLEWKLCIYVSSYLNMRSSLLLSSQPARFWMASQWRFTQDRTWWRIASWALNPCQSMFHFKCQGIYLLLVWRSVILPSFSGPHFLSFLLFPEVCFNKTSFYQLARLSFARCKQNWKPQSFKTLFPAQRTPFLA